MSVRDKFPQEVLNATENVRLVKGFWVSCHCVYFLLDNPLRFMAKGKSQKTNLTVML